MYKNCMTSIFLMATMKIETTPKIFSSFSTANRTFKSNKHFSKKSTQNLFSGMHNAVLVKQKLN